MSEGPVLVLGSTGATGRWVVKQLLERGFSVRTIVRNPGSLPDLWKRLDQQNLSVIGGNVLKLSDEEFSQQVSECQAVVSCLGHNLTFKGIFGQPRRLVTEASRRVCQTVQSLNPTHPVRFVLMNTTGNVNKDANETVSVAERIVLGLLRCLVPPHPDNEQAAEYLRTEVGQNNTVLEWVAVRPDSLINSDEVSKYDVHPSPIRSAIFNAGKTSRINVAHFMTELICNDELWNKWKGQMPVIYNEEETRS